MTSYTVTATNTFGGNGIALQVEVITGALETGGASGYISDGNSGAGQFTISLTPNYTSSFIVFAADDAESGVTAITPATNNELLTVGVNTDSFEDTTNTYTTGAGYYSGTVTAATPVTVGSSNVTSSGTAPELAVYEIQPSPTWAQDASTPAWVTVTASGAATTASFAPPSGAVLVAIAGCNYSGAGAPGSDIHVTSTPSLTWTLRAYNQAATNNGGVAVYTATVPTVSNPGPPLNQGPLPNFPVTIVSNAGWRGAGHSR